MLKKIDLLAVAQTVIKPEVNEELTFGELARAWLAVTRNGDDLFRLRKWTDAYGDRIAWSLTADELSAAAQGMLAHGYAPGSVNRDIGAIGSMYKWIVGERRAPGGFVSPTLSIRRFPEQIRVVDIEPEAIQRLKDISLTYRDKRFAMFCHLLVDTGARKTELLERVWGDVDMDRRRILLKTSKNGKPRALFFSEPTAQLIRRIVPHRHDSALLFPSRDQVTPINYRASWLSLTKAAGIPDCHMHDVRHCRAKELLLNGTPIALAAQIMGHGVQVLERRYGVLAVDDKQDAAELSWRSAA